MSTLPPDDDDLKKSADEIDKELREIAELQEDLKRRAYRLKLSRNDKLKEEAYGPRKNTNLDIPIADKLWLKRRAQEEENRPMWQIISDAIGLYRKKVESDQS